jgi:hypothetical protein
VDLVCELVNELNTLTPALLQPAAQDAIANSTYARITLTQENDINHLNEKHPEASTLLRQRLGRLNWHRKSHKESRSHPPEDDMNGYGAPHASQIPPHPRSPASVAATSVLPADSVIPQTNISTEPSTFPSSTRSLFDPPQPDNDSQSSIGTMSSYAATVHPQDDKHIPVPGPPPACLEGLPFDCEICHRRITNLKGARKWKRHVFQDLRSHVCTHGGCRI